MLGALLGCAPAAQDPGCEPDSDSHFRFDVFGTDATPLPDGSPVRGRIVAWAPDVEILGKDGVYGFGLIQDEGMLPGSPGEGPFDVVARGFDPPMGELPSPALLLRDPDDGALVWMAGNVELPEPLGGWTVESPRDEATCRTWPGEAGVYRNKPVTFAHEDGTTATLFTGQELEIDGARLAVSAAQSNTRNHPFAPCDEPNCPWEKLSWMITRADGPDAAD